VLSSVIATLAVVALVAGCGAPPTEAEREAGLAYARVADEADRQIQVNAETLRTSAGSHDDFFAYYERWADIERSFIDGAKQIEVPESIDADLRRVIAAYERVEGIVRGLATDTSADRATVQLELDRAIEDAINASNEVRRKTGLPAAGSVRVSPSPTG
jgi:hypothetical protein